MKQISTKISLVILVYNEEIRIPYILDNAVQWADEIVVINKSSTDNTKIICESYKGNIKIIDIPYSRAGEEDTIKICSYPSNPWIFFLTSSEIPTRKLIQQINEVINDNPELDLLYIPRKMYSLGIHSKHSPWYISYYPFCFNRNNIVISNHIHNNFAPKNYANTLKIKFEDDCCVLHMTHSSALAYMNRMTEYFISEANQCKNPDKKISECFQNIAKYEKVIRKGGTNLLGIYCSWPIYWLGTALFIWEKYRNIDVNKYYQQLRIDLLKKDWGVDRSNQEQPLLNSDYCKPEWNFNRIHYALGADPYNFKSCHNNLINAIKLYFLSIFYLGLKIIKRILKY
jgi:hypothetical protein